VIFKINFPLLLKLIISFIIFTAVGTVTHELGHLIPAQLLGFETTLHYDSLNWGGRENTKIESFWILIGGPIQSMLTGTIGFVILLKRRIQNKLRVFNFSDWFWLFIALFWIRQPFNLIVSLVDGLKNNKEQLFGGDEYRISQLLGLAEGSLSILTGAIGLFIAYYLTFRIIPKRIRITFILSAFFGASLGWWIWMKQLGPLILP
tara:strand:- start:390 stop:1004 length:615 start_codon:yes stop_codon:yes gene_type:complete